MTSVRRILPLLVLLPTLALQAEELRLDVPFPVAGGEFQIKPIRGMRFHPPQTDSVEAFFLGELEGYGPASLVILQGGERSEIPSTPEELQSYQKEVAQGLEAPQILGSQMLPPVSGFDGGTEMEFLLTQFVGGEQKRMFMIQRQIPLGQRVFLLTSVCLASSRETLRPWLIRSLDSFASHLPPPRTPEERIQQASRLLDQGRLEEAERLAAGMAESESFLPRLGALRLRMTALLGMGDTRGARDLIGDYIELWRADSRPFSAHYLVLLRRGMKDYLQRLHAIERSKLDPGARAALAQVALTVWAGPAQMVPPYLTEKQDRFFAALQKVGEAQGPAVAAAWSALAPSLENAAGEVEGFLTKSRDKGVRLDLRAADYQWLESSLMIPLVAALKQGDQDRFHRVLELFSEVGPGKSDLYRGNLALEVLGEELGSGPNLSFHDLAFRLWQKAGEGLYERTRELLESKGLVGLFQTSQDLSATSP